MSKTHKLPKLIPKFLVAAKSPGSCRPIAGYVAFSCLMGLSASALAAEVTPASQLEKRFEPLPQAQAQPSAIEVTTSAL